MPDPIRANARRVPPDRARHGRPGAPVPLPPAPGRPGAAGSPLPPAPNPNRLARRAGLPVVRGVRIPGRRVA